MIICPQCGKENQDHYKFCLGCGAELQEGAAPPAASGASGASDGPGRGVPPTDAQAPIPAPGSTAPASTSESAASRSAEAPQASPSKVSASIPKGMSSGPLPAASPPPATAAVEVPSPFQAASPELPPPFQEPAADLPPPFPGPSPEVPSPFQAPEIPSPLSTAPAPSALGTDPVSSLEVSSQQAVPPQATGTKPPNSALTEAAADRAYSQDAETNSPPAQGISCPNCQQINPAGFAFCGNCGGRLSVPASPSPLAASPAPFPGPKTRLTLIRPDGSEGGRHVLAAQETLIGRGSGPLFDSDAYLSPQHLRILIEGSQVTLEDLDSLNGVFVRLTSDEALDDGNIFRIGQELLRFDAIGDPSPADDGTDILGSPNPGYWGRLSLIVRRGVDGSSFPLMGTEMLLGRDRGDILFSDDGYVSGLHAKLSIGANNSVELSDLGSSNGTFVKLTEPRTVPLGTFLLMGQQLFRIEAP